MACHALLGLLAACALSVGIARVDDAASLVQSRLAVNSLTTASNESVAPVVTAGATLFRFVFSQNFGATYSCLTEIEFYDINMTALAPTFVSQSSCYGCATSCDQCVAAYGDPRAQFDGKAMDGTGALMSVEDSLWSCSSSGSFTDSKGELIIELELAARPARYIFRRAHVGDWVAKAWVMQEWTPATGIWKTVSTVTDAAKTRDQSIDVLAGVDAKPFPLNWKKCGGMYPNNIESFTPDAAGTALNTEYKMGLHLAVVNNGQGAQVDGNFGTLTLEDGTYDALTLHFSFPSVHKLPGSDDYAMGELNILHQRELIIGEPTRQAVLTILLQLPQEGAGEQIEEEMFFRGAGLDSLPAFGSSAPVPAIDLNALHVAIASPVTAVKCTSGMHWFVSSGVAHVSGFVVQAFRDAQLNGLNAFNGPTLSMEAQDEAGVDSLAGDAEPVDFTPQNRTDANGKVVPVAQPLSPTQMADAYATGEWGRALPN